MSLFLFFYIWFNFMPKYNTRKFNLISSVKWKKIFIFFVFEITLFGSHAMSDCTVAILFCKLKFLLLLQNVMKTIKPFFLCFFFFVHLRKSVCNMREFVYANKHVSTKINFASTHTCLFLIHIHIWLYVCRTECMLNYE